MSIDAMLVGISYEDYWALEPSLITELMFMQLDKINDKKQHDYNTTWMNAMYVGLAFNVPKKFPKEPMSVIVKEKTAEEELDQQASALMNLKGKDFGKVKKVVKVDNDEDSDEI